MMRLITILLLAGVAGCASPAPTPAPAPQPWTLSWTYPDSISTNNVFFVRAAGKTIGVTRTKSFYPVLQGQVCSVLVSNRFGTVSSTNYTIP